MLGSFRALSIPARLLVVNQFGINVGFYLVLPSHERSSHAAGSDGRSSRTAPGGPEVGS